MDENTPALIERLVEDLGCKAFHAFAEQARRKGEGLDAIEFAELQIRDMYRAGALRTKLSESQVLDAIRNTSHVFEGLNVVDMGIARLMIMLADGVPEFGNVDGLKRWIDYSREWWKKYWVSQVWNTSSGAAWESALAHVAQMAGEAKRVGIDLKIMICAIVMRDSMESRDPNHRAEMLLNHLFYDSNRTLREKGRAREFLDAWRESGFSRVNISHRLIASLAFTDVPDDDVNAPWEAWSIVVPDGIFEPFRHPSRTVDGALEGSNEGRLQLRRIWARGVAPEFCLFDWQDGERTGSLLADFKELNPNGADDTARFHNAITNIVRGIAEVIASAPPKRRGSWGWRSRKHGKERVEQQGPIWEVAHPVELDLREELRDWLAGDSSSGKRAGARPTATWVVRGHWRNQAHGPGRSLRRRQWIQPYRKGDDSLRKLIRTTNVD